MSEVPSFVHLIDDDEAFLTATARLFRASGLRVKTFASARKFLDALTPEARGRIVSDLQMPGMTGLELQTELFRVHLKLPIIFLSGCGSVSSAVRAMHDGAEDFLEKLDPKEKLLEAVTQALAREARERQHRGRQRELQGRFDLLSDREREVLSHVVRGWLNKQIAEELGISERTVKDHRSKITTKLKAPSAAELTRLTLEVGLFSK